VTISENYFSRNCGFLHGLLNFQGQSGKAVLYFEDIKF
jgi:hypothetical protein